MSDAAAEKAARLAGPIAALDPTGVTGVYRYAASTSNTQVTLPARSEKRGGQSVFAGRFMRVQAVGCQVDFAQGLGSAPILVLNQASAFGTGHASAGGTAQDGKDFDFVVDNRTTHLAWICSNTTGFVVFYVSDTPGAP